MTDLKNGSFEKIWRNFFGSTFWMSMCYNVCAGDESAGSNDGKFILCAFDFSNKHKIFFLLQYV